MAQHDAEHPRDDENDFNDFLSNTTCCNQTIGNNTHRVEVEFTTSVVQNEYIVRFDKYYKSQTREKYVKAALNQSQVLLIYLLLLYFTNISWSNFLF